MSDQRAQCCLLPIFSYFFSVNEECLSIASAVTALSVLSVTPKLHRDQRDVVASPLVSPCSGRDVCAITKQLKRSTFLLKGIKPDNKLKRNLSTRL